MSQKILSCVILKHELECIIKEKGIEVDYLDAGLHVEPDKLAEAMTTALDNLGEPEPTVVIGTLCHPEMEKIAAEQGAKVVKAVNCIEMLIGEDKMKELEAEARTFYLTSGWLENWEKIFIEGLKWDTIDARQNLGFYDRLLLLDTGLVPVDEEKIFEFFEYSQVPIEILPIDLDYFESLINSLLDRS